MNEAFAIIADAMDELLRDVRRLSAQAVLQILIVGVSAPGLYLATLPPADPRLVYGHGLMLLAQPLWILATVHARQWGMLLVAVFYTGAWTQGFFNHL